MGRLYHGRFLEISGRLAGEYPVRKLTRKGIADRSAGLSTFALLYVSIISFTDDATRNLHGDEEHPDHYSKPHVIQRC